MNVAEDRNCRNVVIEKSLDNLELEQQRDSRDDLNASEYGVEENLISKSAKNSPTNYRAILRQISK